MSSKSLTASAVAMVNPRDIAFVVDLSGSMHFDTMPDQSSANTAFIQTVYDDLGFGTYPGTERTRHREVTYMDPSGQLSTLMPHAVPASRQR